MNEEELIRFLKKNMRVYLNEGSCCDTPTISVSVYIGNEEICTSDPIDL